MMENQQHPKHPKHLIYFFLYFISLLLYATHMIGLGSYIPYLSSQTGLIQTEYSFLFTCRSVGMVIGAISIKILQGQGFKNHTLLIGGASIICVSSFLFAYSRSSFWLGVWLVVASIGYCVFEVVINICLLLIIPPEEIDYWLNLAHGAFGVGGLLSPLIVYIFQIKAYMAFGSFMLFLMIAYLFLKTPQQNGFVPEHKTSPKLKVKYISQNLEYLLILTIFLYVGIECTFGGWISSFAVLAGVTDKNGATVFPGLFWIFITIFRFFFAFFPGNSTYKMKILYYGNIFSGIISLAIIYCGYPSYACYVSSFLFGMFMSSIYPFVWTIPIEHGLIIKDQQATHIGMAAVVSEGMVTMIVGLLMEWIGVNMLFYSLVIIVCIMLILYSYTLDVIVQQKKVVKDSQLHLELLETVEK